MDRMPEGVARSITAHAAREMPNEACGFVLFDWSVIHCKNIANFPNRAFRFEPEVVLDMLLSRHDEVVGIYHTHPSGRGYPSGEDESMLVLHPKLRHWIGTVMNVYEWRMTDDGVRPVRRDGTTGIEGMAYPVLEAAEAVRRTG